MQDTSFKYVVLQLAGYLIQKIKSIVDAHFPEPTDEMYVKKLCRIRGVDTQELFRIISKDAGFNFDDRHIIKHADRFLWHSEIPIYVEDFIRKNKEQIDNFDI